MLSALVSNDFPPFGAASQSLVFMINFGATGQSFMCSHERALFDELRILHYSIKLILTG